MFVQIDDLLINLALVQAINDDLLSADPVNRMRIDMVKGSMSLEGRKADLLRRVMRDRRRTIVAGAGPADLPPAAEPSGVAVVGEESEAERFVAWQAGRPRQVG